MEPYVGGGLGVTRLSPGLARSDDYPFVFVPVPALASEIDPARLAPPRPARRESEGPVDEHSDRG